MCRSILSIDALSCQPCADVSHILPSSSTPPSLDQNSLPVLIRTCPRAKRFSCSPPINLDRLLLARASVCVDELPLPLPRVARLPCTASLIVFPHSLKRTTPFHPVMPNTRGHAALVVYNLHGEGLPGTHGQNALPNTAVALFPATTLRTRNSKSQSVRVEPIACCRRSYCLHTNEDATRTSARSWKKGSPRRVFLSRALGRCECTLPSNHSMILCVLKPAISSATGPTHQSF